MGRKRSCSLCGLELEQGVAAHACPHGHACRYRCRPDGLPLDWVSAECTTCRAAQRRAGPAATALRLVETGGHGDR